jgi:hypothetical protein
MLTTSSGKPLISSGSYASPPKQSVCPRAPWLPSPKLNTLASRASAVVNPRANCISPPGFAPTINIDVRVEQKFSQRIQSIERDQELGTYEDRVTSAPWNPGARELEVSKGTPHCCSRALVISAPQFQVLLLLLLLLLAEGNHTTLLLPDTSSSNP